MVLSQQHGSFWQMPVTFPKAGVPPVPYLPLAGLCESIL